MTRYEQGFLTKCAEYGLDAGVSISMLKLAKQTFDFETGNVAPGSTYETTGNGISTRSKVEDYHGLYERVHDFNGNRHIPSGYSEMPEITRLRYADGSVKYRVTRRLPTDNLDRVGRQITENFSVVVDSPLKAMRLAKGRVSFDPETKSLLDMIQKSRDGTLTSLEERARLARVGINDQTHFDIPKKFSLTSDGIDRGLYKVKRTTVQVEKPNYFKILKRIAKLHPGKTKAIAAAVAALGIGGAGATTAAVVHKNKKR